MALGNGVHAFLRQHPFRFLENAPGFRGRAMLRLAPRDFPRFGRAKLSHNMQDVDLPFRAGEKPGAGSHCRDCFRGAVGSEKRFHKGSLFALSQYGGAREVPGALSGSGNIGKVRYILALPLLLSASLTFAATPSTDAREHRLRFFHTHTGEHLDVVYRLGDQYIPDALERVDQFLRDHRTGDVHHYDPRLLDLLSDLLDSVGRAGAELHVICGYRTPWSNNFLRTHTAGVAEHSLHMQAEAIDIRLPGLKTSAFRDAALALHRGGVGYYAKSDFIHVDVGRIRRW